jgi:hypothetical protein
MKPKRNLFTSLLICACAPVAAQAADIDVIGNAAYSQISFASTNNGVDGGLGTQVRVIAGTYVPGQPNVNNVTWTNNNTYFITDKLFIPRGATLTIQPGTKIYSSIDDNGTPSDKTDDKVGSITACRGGKLIADGTAALPIIFSSVKEWETLPGNGDSPFDTDLVDSTAADVGPEDGGQWGGIILLGQSFCSFVNASGVNAGTVQIEGFAPAGSPSYDGNTIPDATQYGISTNFPITLNDNSGVIRYVSIRHGGYEFSSGREINGLTLGAVGSGTTISHVEVYANQDDGIEFFGGTVNTDHIVMAFNQDDSFDIDEGYNGTNQFWFGIQNPGAADSGGEWDGVGGTTAGFNLGDTAANHANPKIYNGTFIGAGRSNTLSQLPITTGTVNWEKGNFALHIEDYFAGEIYNSVFDDYSADLIKYNDNAASVGVNFKFKHNTIGRFGDTAQKQIETSTVTTGTVTAGTLNVSVTGSGIGSPLVVGVALTGGETRTQTTAAIVAALAGTPAINALYAVQQGTDRFVYLTAVTAGSNDSTLLVSIPATNGLTANSSANTQAGATAAVDPLDNTSYISGTGPANVIFDGLGDPVDGNSNADTNPQLTAYTRDGSSFLTSINPSPTAVSPLANGASIAGGAPVNVGYRGAFAPGANSNWAAGWTKLSTSGVLLGGAAPLQIVDTDGDGVSDAVEGANTDLGLNPAVNDASTVLPSLYTTSEFTANYTAGQTSVTSNPNAFSLYNTADILDLRTTAGVTVQKVGNDVTLSVPVEKSTGLNTWAPAGNMTLGPFTGDPTKEFYRLEVQGAN